MPEEPYIFKSTEDGSELARLQLLEKIHDSSTLALINPIGDLAGKRCLEVGAGAGSVTKALSQRVGPDGEVWAVDLNTRFLTDLNEPNIKVLSEDIRNLELPKDYFDLIHTRYVVCHIPNAEVVLDRFYDLLTKGGYLALEEHDHTIAHPQSKETPEGQSVNRVMQAVIANFTKLGMDPAFGFHLPQLLQKYIWQEFGWTAESRQVRGGSDIAKFIGLSIDQIREQLVETGEAKHADVDTYVKFSQDESQAAVFYATGRALAQK